MGHSEIKPVVYDKATRLSSEHSTFSEELDVPDRGHAKQWKPWTLSTGFLVPMAIFTAGLAVLLGLLQLQTARHGALFFASTANGFTFTENFLYRYLPTIVIVLYGMAWSWIDLDVKRLEPWFQLAQSGGVSAEKSLLLNYPVDFLPLVPFKAAKLRQWTVVCASTTMIFVVWAVTPLQNGIFSNSIATLPTITPLRTSTAFLPLVEQSARLGGNILNTAYSTLWLGQETLPFNTFNYALAPFESDLDLPLIGSNQTLSSQTTLYSTNLECRAPAQVLIGPSDITFDDGRGCVAEDLIVIGDTDADKRFTSYYIGYYDDPRVDQDLELAGCGLNASHEILLVWKLSSSDPPDFHNSSNATALFCTPTYHKQFVNATVSLPDYAVLSTIPLGPKTLLSDQDFNVTQFEYLLANGVPPAVTSSGRQDIANTATIQQDARLENMTLNLPITNMVGFAVGSTHFAPSDYLDPTNLTMAFERAHQLLFSIAVQNVLKPVVPQSVALGVINSTFQTVSLVPVFVFVSLGFLVLIVGSTLALLFTTSSRPSALCRDPDSLAQVMFLASSPSLQQRFVQYGSANASAISKALSTLQFDLISFRGTQPTIRQIMTPEIAGAEQGSEKVRDGLQQHDMVQPTSQSVGPSEYGRWLGLSFSASLAGVIAVLVVLHTQMLANDGLPLPSQNALAQQVLLDLLPTMVATVMEPVWVLLTRLACMMRPLEELRSGHVSARRSLLLEYTSIPPQMVAWRALRAGHFFLAALGVVTILANLLTVALSGLFTQADVTSAKGTQLKQLYQHKSGNSSDFNAFISSLYSRDDPFYVAAANFSGVSALPPWTTPHFGFFPLDLSSPRASNRNDNVAEEGPIAAVDWNMQIMGYGADLNCQTLSDTPSDASFDLKFASNASSMTLVTSNKQPDGSVVQCVPTTSFAIEGDPAGKKALEFTQPMVDLSSSNSSVCKNMIVRGWLRATTEFSAQESGLQSDASAPQNLPNATSMSTSQTFISCQPRLKTATFNLTVSSYGQVIDAVQISTATYNEVPTDASPWTTLQGTTDALGPFSVSSTYGVPTWHNDTIANEWFNYLAKVLTNSTALLDAQVAPPDPATVSNLTSDIYSRLFAIQMSLQTPGLLPAAADATLVPARRMTVERRIFMSEPLYYISVVILSFDLLMAIVFYCRVPPPFLPRLPINLASQIAFFAGSHVIDDIRNAGVDLRELDRRGYRYGYGRYVGKDGKPHVGIERDPYVMPLAKDESGGWWSGLRKRRARGKGRGHAGKS